MTTACLRHRLADMVSGYRADCGRRAMGRSTLDQIISSEATCFYTLCWTAGLIRSHCLASRLSAELSPVCFINTASGSMTTACLRHRLAYMVSVYRADCRQPSHHRRRRASLDTSWSTTNDSARGVSVVARGRMSDLGTKMEKGRWYCISLS